MRMESGLDLAYLGDAVFELKIREHLMKTGLTKVNDLHQKAITYTSASSQAKAIKMLLPTLSDEENIYYLRGRNAGSTHKPKNASLKEYHESTGFESIIGYLYLEKKDDRINEIVNQFINFIINGK